MYDLRLNILAFGLYSVRTVGPMTRERRKLLLLNYLTSPNIYSWPFIRGDFVLFSPKTCVYIIFSYLQVSLMIALVSVMVLMSSGAILLANIRQSNCPSAI